MLNSPKQSCRIGMDFQPIYKSHFLIVGVRVFFLVSLAITTVTAMTTNTPTTTFTSSSNSHTSESTATTATSPSTVSRSRPIPPPSSPHQTISHLPPTRQQLDRQSKTAVNFRPQHRQPSRENGNKAPLKAIPVTLVSNHEERDLVKRKSLVYAV